MRDGELSEQIPPDGDIRALRLTTVGAYAHQHLSTEFQYLDAVAVDTPVADPEIRSELKDVHAIRPRLERVELLISYLDAAWARSDLAPLGFFDWPTCAKAVRAEVKSINSRL
jgi:hypothetical protein